MRKTFFVTASSRQTKCERRRLALVLAFGGVGFASGASAQWAVIDAGNIATNQAGFASQLAKTVEQYAQQIKQYQTQLQQYQQMLSSIRNLSNGLSLAPNRLQQITNTDALIQGKCAGASSPAGLVSSVMNSMSSLMTQSITQTQQMLCAQIVLTQVDKYNKTVIMLNRLHDDYGGQFQQMDQMAAGVDTQADAERAATQVAKYSSAVSTDMSNWQAQMQADDAVISTLQSQQSILGHVALKGSSTVLGNVVEAATFAAAFQ